MRIIKDGESLEAVADATFHAATGDAKPGEAVGTMTKTLDDVQKTAMDRRIDIIDMPSRGLFYEEDGIAFRPFMFREYAMLSAAQSSDSFKSLAEAICLTVINYKGMNLTFPDFRYIMYRHRIQMNRPFEIEWECDNPEHIAWNEQGWMPVEPDEDYPDGQKPLDPNRFRQSRRLTKSDIRVTYPDEERLKQYLNEELMISEGLYLFPTRVADSIQIEEDRNSIFKQAARGDWDPDDVQAMIEELEFNSSYAMILNPNVHGETLEERRNFIQKWFEELDPEYHAGVIQKLDQFLIDSEHDVTETINVKCGVCGHEQAISIAFNPTDFFPEVQARSTA